MEPIHRVAVVTKPACDEDFTYTRMVVRTMLDLGFEVYISQAIKYRLGELRDAVHLCYNDHELLDTAQAIAVLGGDGTMLEVAVRAAAAEKPVVGINLGHLGFLTALEKNEPERLVALKEGNYEIERRMLLELEVQTRFTTYRKLALNDIVISAGVCARMAELTLRVGDAKQIGYHADGLIVATPTGSTAYSLSAGGPVLDPTLDAITVTPICPHTLLRTALIFRPEATLSVSGHTRDSRPDLYVTADGKDSFDVPCDAEIRIRRSPLTAKIIRIGESRFYDIIESKLN